jgi:hypothetical protein
MRLIFGYINIDARIASYNIHAYQSLPANYEKNRKDYGPFKKSTSLDTRYLFTLSADAAIPLLSLQKK